MNGKIQKINAKGSEDLQTFAGGLKEGLDISAFKKHVRHL
jgi:hypothetical protein